MWGLFYICELNKAIYAANIGFFLVVDSDISMLNTIE